MRPEHHCAVCAALLPEHVGRARPYVYCAEHAPPDRARDRAYQREHAAHIRELARAHSGYRPIVAAVCAACRLPFGTWSGAALCTRCRHLKRPFER